MKNNLYAKARQRTRPAEPEVRLRKQVVKLKKLRAADQQELTELRADREALIRVVHQLPLENRQLRQQLATPDPVVRVLPTQPQPPVV
ncbi:hypothetical protein [Streptomyces sp. 1222.5]|uniref:hypothetical protein n=1 Tax=Streptomyces sp. 1222.5 TaxID=1881026 RepID=UPI003EBFBEC9